MASWEEKLKLAATRAAFESMHHERQRCIWILKMMIQEVEFELSRKLLMEQERHAIEVKLAITKAVVAKAIGGIVSGLRPEGVQDGPNRNGDHRNGDDRDSTAQPS